MSILDAGGMQVKKAREKNRVLGHGLSGAVRKNEGG